MAHKTSKEKVCNGPCQWFMEAMYIERKNESTYIALVILGCIKIQYITSILRRN